MSYSIVNSQGAHVTGTSNPSITTTFSASVGNTLVVVVLLAGTVKVNSATDSLGNVVNVDASYTAVTLNTSSRTLAFCSLPNITTGGTRTLTFACSGTDNTQIWVYEVNGLGTNASFDKATTTINTGDSTSPVTGSLTPSMGSSFLIGAFLNLTGGTTWSSWTNGFTFLNYTTLVPPGAAAWATSASTPTATTAGATLSATDYWGSALAAYNIGSTGTNYSLSGSYGSYRLSGESVTLTEGGVTNYSLSVANGAYSLNGINAQIGGSTDYILVGNSGTYDYVGGYGTYGYGLISPAGYYSISGNDAPLQPIANIPSHVGNKSRRFIGCRGR